MTDDTPMHPSNTNALRLRRLWRHASVVLALVLIVIILRSISFQEIVEALQSMQMGYLFLAYSLNVGVVALMAYRWWLLYTIVDAHPTYFYLLKVSFVGVFFNNVLPSTIGGDVYRALHMARPKDGRAQLSRSFATVFLDRLIGLLGLLLIGVLAFFMQDTVAIPGGARLWIPVTLGLFVLAAYLSMRRGFYDLVARLFFWLPPRFRSRIVSVIYKIRDHITLYADHKGLLLRALGVSIAQRAIWLWGCYLVGLSLDLRVSPLAFFAALPVIEVIRLMPLTVQGIGVREGLFVLFFGAAGVTSSKATLLAALIYTLLSLNGLVGGAIYLRDMRRTTESHRDRAERLSLHPEERPRYR